MNKIINGFRVRISKRAKNIYSLAILAVVLTAALTVTLVTSNHSPNSQSAKLVIEKTPLVANTTQSQPITTTLPVVSTKPTTGASSTPANIVHVVTPTVSAKQTTTPTTQPVIPVTSHTTPTPPQTPLSALTTVISDLESGQSVNITASSVVIPGPISDATGQPIVFVANNQTYFAYTQEQEPDFINATPAQTASTMAIVSEPESDSGIALSPAYLDKGGILVNPDQVAVGYSTGGN